MKVEIAEVYGMLDSLRDHAPKLPSFNLGDDYHKMIKEYNEDIDKFLNSLKDVLTSILRDDIVDAYTGEILKIPHADGYALYAVVNASSQPSLMHIDIEDGWESPIAYRMTAQDIVDKINSQKALEKIFSK